MLYSSNAKYFLGDIAVVLVQMLKFQLTISPTYTKANL